MNLRYFIRNSGQTLSRHPPQSQRGGSGCEGLPVPGDHAKDRVTQRTKAAEDILIKSHYHPTPSIILQPALGPKHPSTARSRSSNPSK